MNILEIAASQNTPKVNFNPVSGELSVSGNSYPGNARAFYDPILIWLGDYLENPATETILTIQLSYFNTPTNKYVLEIVKLLQGLESDKKIIWRYQEDDEEMLEYGEKLEAITELEFVFEEF